MVCVALVWKSIRCGKKVITPLRGRRGGIRHTNLLTHYEPPLAITSQHISKPFLSTNLIHISNIYQNISNTYQKHLKLLTQTSRKHLKHSQTHLNTYQKHLKNVSKHLKHVSNNLKNVSKHLKHISKTIQMRCRANPPSC